MTLPVSPWPLTLGRTESDWRGLFNIGRFGSSTPEMISTSPDSWSGRFMAGTLFAAVRRAVYVLVLRSPYSVRSTATNINCSNAGPIQCAGWLYEYRHVPASSSW